MDEGRAVPHGKVKAWLESWGAEKELPAPECE
jgi:predicted transcriptional regulator